MGPYVGKQLFAKWQFRFEHQNVLFIVQELAISFGGSSIGEWVFAGEFEKNLDWEIEESDEMYVFYAALQEMEVGRRRL